MESVSEVTDNATGISDDNIKALPGDNKAIAGEGVRKEGAPLARDVAPARMAAANTGKPDDKDHKRLKMFLSFRCNQPLSPILAN